MEKIKNTQLAHPAQATKQEGVWLHPKEAAPYFRNGKGVKLSSLLNNLRTGKLQDISYRDAFGWHVFIPQHLLNNQKQTA